MKLFKIHQFYILIISFLVVFFLPKPDLRVEKLRHSISANSNVLIIGNSILEHQSPCEQKIMPVREMFKNINVIGEGGLLFEEIGLAVHGKKIKNLIIVASTYNFFQPKYYPIQTKIYYKDYNKDWGKMSENNFAKKTLWRLDESIKYGNSHINRGEASLKIKKSYHVNRCSEFQWTDTELIEEIHKHSHNYFGSTANQLEIIDSLNHHYNLKLIVVPVWMSGSTYSSDTYLEYNSALSRIRNELTLKHIKFEILNLENDISNYDEPWCMCGHLSAKGRDKLLDSIRGLVN
jgi:hypothetical protein